MAVLKAPPKQPKTTVVQLRLDDEARTKLTKYAEFLGMLSFSIALRLTW